MSYQLVIAEKPSVAQSIAKILGVINRKEGYLEGNGYLISWCIGHLIGLANAESYNEKYSKECSAVLCGQASTGSSDAVADTDSGGTSDYILSLRFGGFSDRIIRTCISGSNLFCGSF